MVTLATNGVGYVQETSIVPSIQNVTATIGIKKNSILMIDMDVSVAQLLAGSPSSALILFIFNLTFDYSDASCRARSPVFVHQVIATAIRKLFRKLLGFWSPVFN